MVHVLNGKVRYGLALDLIIELTASHLQIGFTAIVNKELSAKYDTMVNNATKYIESLPWGKDFEVDVFKKPDFTGERIPKLGYENAYLETSPGDPDFRNWWYPCWHQCKYLPLAIATELTFS
jgi:hypothetical protein